MPDTSFVPSIPVASSYGLQVIDLLALRTLFLWICLFLSSTVGIRCHTLFLYLCSCLCSFLFLWLFLFLYQNTLVTNPLTIRWTGMLTASSLQPSQHHLPSQHDLSWPRTRQLAGCSLRTKETLHTKLSLAILLLPRSYPMGRLLPCTMHPCTMHTAHLAAMRLLHLLRAQQ